MARPSGVCCVVALLVFAATAVAAKTTEELEAEVKEIEAMIQAHKDAMATGAAPVYGGAEGSPGAGAAAVAISTQKSEAAAADQNTCAEANDGTPSPAATPATNLPQTGTPSGADIANGGWDRTVVFAVDGDNERTGPPPCGIDVVAELSLAEFRSKYRGKRPVIVDKVGRDWPATALWTRDGE